MRDRPSLCSTWSSSFAPSYRTQDLSAVGTTSWHKHDPVTSRLFFVETSRRHSPFYHDPSQDVDPSIITSGRGVQRVKKRAQPVGLPDPAYDALLARERNRKYVTSQLAYQETFDESIAATQRLATAPTPSRTWLRSSGSWVNPFKLPEWKPTYNPTILPPKLQPTLTPIESRTSTRTSHKRSRNSKRSKAPKMTIHYTAWDPPGLPDNLGSRPRRPQRVRLADRAIIDAVFDDKVLQSFG